MNFRNFLLNETKLQIVAGEGLETHLPQAKQALEKYLMRYGDRMELKSASSRYIYKLIRYDPNYWKYITLEFELSPISKGGREEIITDPNDDRWTFYKNWDGKTGKTLYKTPKDAIAEIPADPNLAYRGMSWEEWKSIEEKGYIQSAGGHNFSNQNGLTFYGPDPGTGENYASGFAPDAYKHTPKRPGIVIAVPRNLLKDSKQNKAIPQGELAHEGPLPAKNIVAVWMIVATKSRPGKLELMLDKKTGSVTDGTRFGIGMSYSIRRFK